MSTTFQVRPTGTLHERRIDYVERIEVGDERPGCQHVFNHPPYDGGFTWNWGPPGRTRFHPNLVSSQRWAYVVHFNDGTRGVCKVMDINRALAACNYRIDEMIAREVT